MLPISVTSSVLHLMDVCRCVPGVSALFSALGYMWETGKDKGRTIHIPAFCTGNVGQTTGDGFSVGRKQDTRERHEGGPVNHVASTDLEFVTLGAYTPPCPVFFFFLVRKLYCKEQGALSTFQSMCLLSLGQALRCLQDLGYNKTG